MEEPRDAPPLGIVHDRIEPLGLQRLLALSAIEEQRVETDETIALDVHPPVGAEMGAPALEQNFVAHRPDQVWLADITQIATSEGWLYLAVILDLFTRKVVGWAIRSRVHDAKSPANERISTVSPSAYPATTDIDPVSGRPGAPDPTATAVVRDDSSNDPDWK